MGLNFALHHLYTKAQVSRFPTGSDLIQIEEIMPFLWQPPGSALLEGKEKCTKFSVIWNCLKMFLILQKSIIITVGGSAGVHMGVPERKL